DPLPPGDGQGDGRPRRRGAARARGVLDHRPSAGAGSALAPRTVTSKCRCGPVEKPVVPTRPTRAPTETNSPGRTESDERWAWRVWTPVRGSSKRARPKPSS